MIFIFLSSGLFLGWSLGANDASNIFGTAVATKMVRFKTAALIASVFALLGAVIGGAGAAHTLGKLGAVNALAGSFMVALASAITVFGMTKLNMPVSVSQAIVGAIIGWNFFSNNATDYSALGQIFSTWIVCPLLAAVLAIIFYFAFKFILNRSTIHLLRLDTFTRIGLVLAGAFGAYSLGANNIANVMGVFVPVIPFPEISFFGLLTLSSAQQLFLLGGLAIGVGIFTYSYKVMGTVGGNLYRLSPVGALVVVLAESLVLFMFSSEQLEAWLIHMHLPTIPLVPVSSTQAVIGAVIGIALARGGRGIRYRVLGEIALGWVVTPVISGLIAFVALFFLQNVFDLEVSRNVEYEMSPAVIQYLAEQNITDPNLSTFSGNRYQNSMKLVAQLRQQSGLSSSQRIRVIEAAEIYPISVSAERLAAFDAGLLNAAQEAALQQLQGGRFQHKWELMKALQGLSAEWQFKAEIIEHKLFNKSLRNKMEYLYSVFRINEEDEPAIRDGDSNQR
jgi:PiT family inorganic phosphate transporter